MMLSTMKQEFEKKVFTDAEGRTLPYRFLKPERCDPRQKYPLALFLHGAGEKGEDNERQITNGAEQFASPEVRETYPCFVAVPQCPEHHWWTDAAVMRMLFGLLESIGREYAVDPGRVYITGVSMGGFGTWEAIERHPDYFAAAVPVCGGGNPADAARIRNVPVWVFHGAADRVVDVAYSREMVEALKAAGGSPRYTEYPGVGHASWNRVYKDPGMYSWLFGQRRHQS